MAHLFEEAKIVENFRTLHEAFPSRTLEASTTPFTYPKSKNQALPSHFDFEGNSLSIPQFLEDSKTTGFLIIQNDSITFENYYLGNHASQVNISWSVAKSFISTLFGIAVDEGYINSLSQNVEEYVPELVGSAYEGVQIKDVLQMSSGIKFNEDYADFKSDINRWGRHFAFGRSQDKFAASLTREREPGTYNKYISIDTHVLGMILTRATKQSITDYMQQKLWEPLGMEHDAYWSIDNTGMEVALCGLNATLRDYAKLGSLYINDGKWQGKQVISSDWIHAATTPDAPHLQAGKNNPQSAHNLGYAYQWWIPDGTDGEFLAQGVYNQFIYGNPATKTVIVKLSANDKFNDESFVPSKWEANLAMFRAIAAAK